VIVFDQKIPGVYQGDFALVKYHAGDDPMNLIAHRTGGKFGEEVAEADEDSNDPTKLLMLTNNDAEEPDAITNGTLDFDNATASIPSGALDPVDDDLMRITLKQVQSAWTSGTVGIELSNSSSVRLFMDDGTELTDLTLDLSNPSGSIYLGNLLNHDVDVWVEGLQKDSDFTFSLVQRNTSNAVVSRDDIHMTIAEWSWIDAGGSKLKVLNKVPKSFLTYNAVDQKSNATLSDFAKFKISIDGLPSAMVDSLKVESSSSADYYLDDYDASTTATVSRDFAVVYSGADSDDLLTASDKASIKSVYGVNAIHNQTTRATLENPYDQQKRDIGSADIQVDYIGGVDPTDATKEDWQPMEKTDFYMKGYMLRFTAPDAKPNTPYQWSVTKVGGAAEVGTCYSLGGWSNYVPGAQLTVPIGNWDNPVLYWRSDLGGSIDDAYVVAVMYTDPATGARVVTSWQLQSRLLDPTDAKAANNFNEDADMAQRAMIQIFGLNKGGLVSYRIGQYDKGSINGWYTNNRAAPKTQLWSAIADEVSNFDKFALGTAAPSEKLELRTVQGIWNQFDQILSAPLPKRVDDTNAAFAGWVGAAVTAGGLASPATATKTAAQILAALAKHESGGGIHSYDLAAPLAASSVQVGENTAGVSADRHVYTDFGIGFVKVQPYNANGKNLYDPAQNLTRGAEIFQARLSSPSNLETGNNAIWIAYYAYNSGGFGGGTVAAARAANATYAARCDAFFDDLGLPHP
jgi:hypothetical protein